MEDLTVLIQISVINPCFFVKFQSWQDLKRYESLKAKESMTKLGKALEQSSMVPLSPLQEKIAHLINESITVSRHTSS